MTKDYSDTTILIPTLNEEQAIGKVIDEIIQTGIPPENILIVDGHSTDKTRQIAQSKGARVILATTPIMTTLLKTSTGTQIESIKKTPIIIITVTTITWLIIVPPSQWKTVFTLLDPTALTLYTLAFLLLAPLATSLIGEKPGPLSTWLPTITLYTLLAITALKGLSPGIQATGPTLALYLTPIALIAPLAAKAHSNLRHKPWIKQNPLPYAYAYTIAGTTAYLALSGTPLGQSPAGRVGNFLIPGLALLYTLAQSRLLTIKSLTMIIVGVLYIQLLLHAQDPATFDQPYHQYEQQTIQYLLSHKQPNQTITTDAKLRDLTYYYTKQKPSNPIPKLREGPLVLYKENLKYGYKLDSNLHTGNPQPIKQELIENPLVYNTGKSWITIHQS